MNRWAYMGSTVAVVAGTAVLLTAMTQVDPLMTGNVLASAEPVRTQTLVAEPRVLTSGDAGSALATAAFGLSALQPETYDGELVLDLIDASPLAVGEKDRLTAKLIAAEAGHGELPTVLADIRTSLAVE